MRYEESPYDPLTARANKMIDMLTEENRKLRDELTVFNRKVSRLQKFEIEIQRVHEAYEGLVRSSKKREQLELIMKKRLEDEIRKLQTKNKQLQGEPCLIYDFTRSPPPYSPLLHLVLERVRLNIKVGCKPPPQKKICVFTVACWKN